MKDAFRSVQIDVSARLRARIDYLRETTPRGSGGALAMLPERPADRLLVLDGDLVTQADLGAMLEFHDRGGFKATLGVRQYSHHVPYGCVEAEDGRVTSFEEKPFVQRLVNGGIYVLAHDLPRRVPSQGEYDMPWLIADCLARGEAVGAFLIADDWIDVGRREQLEAAREGSSS